MNDDPNRRHAQSHFKKTGHPFTINVKRKMKPRSKRVSCLCLVAMALMTCY